jgi:hypothetical protein
VTVKAAVPLLWQAQVDVNVNAPRGTKAKAEGDVEDIRLKQTPQMGGSASTQADSQNDSEE